MTIESPSEALARIEGKIREEAQRARELAAQDKASAPVRFMGWPFRVVICLVALVAFGAVWSVSRHSHTALNPKLTLTHFLIMGAAGLVVLIGYKVVKSGKAEAERFQQQITVQAKMPTAEESIKWAIWDARTKYHSFDIVSTNVTTVTESETYRGEKPGGAAEVAQEKRMFGAAYDAWSKGDSFTRQETSYMCDLVITHTKPKPANQISILVSAAMEGEKPDTNHLEVAAQLLHLQKYSDYKVLRQEVYRVNRTVGGRLMKPVNTERGQMYVWDTEERNKTYVKPKWVLIQEVGNLKCK